MSGRGCIVEVHDAAPALVRSEIAGARGAMQASAAVPFDSSTTPLMVAGGNQNAIGVNAP